MSKIRFQFQMNASFLNEFSARTWGTRRTGEWSLQRTRSQFSTLLRTWDTRWALAIVSLWQYWQCLTVLLKVVTSGSFVSGQSVMTSSDKFCNREFIWTLHRFGCFSYQTPLSTARSNNPPCPWIVHPVPNSPKIIHPVPNNPQIIPSVLHRFSSEIDCL